VVVYLATLLQIIAESTRLHDTTGCQSGLTTVLTTGCIV